MSDRNKPIRETHDALEERVRELACLYEIGDLLEDPDADPYRVFDSVVRVIPLAWAHPETCRARITLERFRKSCSGAARPSPLAKGGFRGVDRYAKTDFALEDLTFQSSDFRVVSPVHKADIFVEGERVGSIEVCGTQQDLQARVGALSSEKCKFIDVIAKRLGSFLSLQRLLRLSASHPVLNREDGISGNHDSTDETGRPTPHETEYGGLCMTCVHSSTCAFPRRKDQPVLSCEEFDDGGGRPTEIAGAANVLGREAQAQASEDGGGSPEYLGLCTTCENRETCTLPKPEGGIWQCEEFE